MTDKDESKKPIPDQEDIQDVCSSLAFLKAFSQEFGDGFVAMVSLDIKRFLPVHRDILVECLTGEISEGGDLFESPVCDNRMQKIVFDSSEAAYKNAVARASSIPKQFIYGAFSVFGVAVSYSAPQQVFLNFPKGK